jgi:hypothetical protein
MVVVTQSEKGKRGDGQGVVGPHPSGLLGLTARRSYYGENNYLVYTNIYA